MSAPVVIGPARSGLRGLVAKHRALAVLLPVSLVVSWTIALTHGDAAAPPPAQGVLAEPLTTLAGSPVWRLAWWLWLAGTLILVEAVARRRGASDHAFLATGSVLIALPATFWAFGWAGTDGPLAFFGALALWLAVRVIDGVGSGWWLALAGLAAGAFGITAVLAFVLVLILIIATPERRRLLGAGITAVGAALALPVLGALTGIGAPLAVSEPPTGGATLGPLGSAIAALNAMITTGLFTLAQRGIGLPGAPEYFFQILGWVLIAGVVVAFLRARRTRVESPIVVATAATVLLAGPVLVIIVRLLSGQWLLIQPTAMTVLLAALLVVTATVIRNRPAAWMVVGWSGIVVIVQIVLVVVATR